MKRRKFNGRTKPNYVRRVGIELEGAWMSQPDGFHGDGSVAGIDNEYAYIGEARTPRGGIEVNAIESWLFGNYPSKALNGTNNKTCGLHIHVSVNSLDDYKRLMTPDFQDAVLATFLEWGINKAANRNIDTRFWRRLGGKEVIRHGMYEKNYCKKIFGAEGQFAMRTKWDSAGDRYCQLNYCYNIQDNGAPRGTLELRMLPMMHNRKSALEAVYLFLQIVEEYLAGEINGQVAKDNLRVAFATEDTDDWYGGARNQNRPIWAETIVEFLTTDLQIEVGNNPVIGRRPAGRR